MMEAVRAAVLIGSLGVNTHIDFAAYGYQNLPLVESSILYLGVENLRDSPEAASDAQTWRAVAKATGAKFDAYVPEGSPANMAASLALMPQLASEGILNAIEGGDEEDDSYPASLGNTLPITALFQQTVFALGKSLGLPVINMSFGSGWTAANDWRGDYGSVGNLSAYCTNANAHTYPVLGQTPDWSIQRINGLASLAAPVRGVATTEIGWDRDQGFSHLTVAKYVLDAVMDGIKDDDARMYFYALFDDGSGAFGLMNQNGTPMQAGTALHDLTTLLADKGAAAATFQPGTLDYSLTGTTANDNTLLFQKSDGTFWITVWNETDPGHKVVVNLPAKATSIQVFDPLRGTTANKGSQSASSITLNLADHPLLVEVVQ
jgi:hypothetical protein